MLRAVKWVQELRLMLDCVLNSVLHLVWCLVLIMFVLIMFALVIVQGLFFRESPFLHHEFVTFMLGINQVLGKYQVLHGAIVR